MQFKFKKGFREGVQNRHRCLFFHVKDLIGGFRLNRVISLFQNWLKKLRLNENFTFLIVPHSNTTVHKLRISKVFVIGLFCCLLIFTAAGGLLVTRYHQLKNNVAELEHLRIVNEEQKEQIETLVTETEEIYSQIEKLHELDEKVRKLLNLSQGEDSALQVASGGELRTLSAGGPVSRGSSRETVEIIEGDLAFISEELEILEENLNDLASKAQSHIDYIDAKPAGWPASGRVTSRFGTRRSPTGRGTEFHNGLDIGNSRGTPIRATGRGRVISSGWQGAYGWTVVIDHGHGYRTLYAHASRLAVKAGDRVKRGSVISYMGSSGRATGPHVHYEVIYKGTNQDPAKFLSKPKY
jgi:murein DD-endopeptidase MepM/ murein hydrolase activator NlpD